MVSTWATTVVPKAENSSAGCSSLGCTSKLLVQMWVSEVSYYRGFWGFQKLLHYVAANLSSCIIQGFTVNIPEK